MTFTSEAGLSSRIDYHPTAMSFDPPRRNFRRQSRFILGTILWLAGLASAFATEPQPLPNPNIIFILADDLGYGDLGCYGQKSIRTPNLDRLAAEGIRFTQAYAGSTVCAPSRCVLMTGLHTGHCRIRGNGDVPLEPEDVTVAEILKGAGYSTVALGKWGIGLENSTGHPNRQGFDEWFGYLDQTLAHNYYPEYLYRNEGLWQLRGNAKGLKGEYSHDLFTRSALNAIKLNQDQRFFLYLAYTIPHAHNELKDQGMEVPSDKPYSNEDWPQPLKNKAVMISRMDTDTRFPVSLV
jgi:arylsulfatase A-like enzyme